MRDLPSLLDIDPIPHLPLSPDDTGRKKPVSSPGKPRGGDLSGVPRQTKRVTTDTREGEEKVTGWKRPGPGKAAAAHQAGQDLGAAFRRLNGSDVQRARGNGTMRSTAGSQRPACRIVGRM